MIRRRSREPDVTLADIAAAVPPPRSIAAAERRLLFLQERLQSLADEVETVGAAMTPGAVAGPVVSSLNAALAEKNRVDALIGAAKRTLAAARAEHADQIRATLHPHIQAAETGIADALAALLMHWSTLDQVDALLKQYGSIGRRDRPSAQQAALLVRRLVAYSVGSAAVDAVTQQYISPARPGREAAD